MIVLIRYQIFLCLFLFGFTKSIYAWHDHGHMTIAAMAWDQLDDSQKKKVTAILRNHPDFQRTWKPAYAPHKALLPLGKFLMMRASVWPQEIAKKSNANHTYNRKTWHYIAQRFYLDKETNDDNPDIQYGKDSTNIVWAIDHVLKNVKKKEFSAQLHAIYFSWLIHLTAKVHQPLHTCALYDSDKLKKGDRGGNELFIRTETDTMRLHSLWDESLGTTTNIKKTLQQGFIYKREMPNDGSFTNEMDPRVWANDSFKIARYDAYLDGKIKYSLNGRNIPLISSSYITTMKSKVKVQAIKAGYRLASQIQSVF